MVPVPKNQISPYHNWVLSQSVNQRELIPHCTKISIDNNYRCDPSAAERTLNGLQWFWIGDILCLTKDEDLHREVAQVMFKKVIAENGEKSLNKINAIDTDFETGLYRPLLQELNKLKKL